MNNHYIITAMIFYLDKPQQVERIVSQEQLDRIMDNLDKIELIRVLYIGTGLGTPAELYKGED